MKMVMEGLFYFIIMASSIPVGFLLSWLCNDEICYGKKWLKLILFVLILLMAVIYWFYYDLSVFLSLVYLFIVTLVSFFKSS